MVGRVATGLFLLTVALLLGCGGGGEAARTQVSGKVTYKGGPLPQGEISFIPDPAAKDAVTGTTPIKDGAYDTRQGSAPSPGPVTVYIVGFDGKANPDQPLGNPMFYWQDKADLPASAITKDFAVPDNAPKKPPESKVKPVIIP
jgi:hypothetical protein